MDPQPLTVAQLQRIVNELSRTGQIEAEFIGRIVPGKTSRRDLTKLEASMVIGEPRNTPNAYWLRPVTTAPRPAPAPLPPCTPEDPCTFCGTTSDEHECTECGETIKDCRVERSTLCAACEREFKY